MFFSLRLFSFISSLESKFKFLIKIKEVVGKNIKTNIEIEIQIFCQEVVVNRYTIKTGKINSAVDRPNQQVLKAFPLDFVKYLEIVVVAVWDIIPCPENLIKNIEINKNVTDEIFEKKKHEKERRRVTKNANLKILMSSIFFPTQIKRKLLTKVAKA